MSQNEQRIPVLLFICNAHFIPPLAKEAQEAVKDQAIAQRDLLYGVDLDEELADLIRYQRSYEASARVFNVANELMQLMVQLGK